MSSRAGGRQAMSELKLRRVIEHNQRLREDLARPRVRVSEASASLIGTARQRRTTSSPRYGAPSGAQRTHTARRPRGARVPCN
ncbi:G-protein gamma subunit, partial [Mycena sp. CBHHK59/15]